MGHFIHLNRILIITLCLISGSYFIQAQQLPYETVTVNGQPYYKYKVQSGQGLHAISRIFSVSVADILRHNPGSNSGLQSGQELLIPQSSGAETKAPGATQKAPINQGHIDQNNSFQHMVVKGETVYSISRMYHTTVEEINRLNPGASEGIAEGSVLIIPQRRVISREKEENYRYHTILPKETLYSVSKTYRLTPQDIMLANPNLSVETFQIGKTIRIPFFESFEVVTPYEKQTTNIIHTVLKGETLYSIARKYEVDVATIEQMNPMLSAGLRSDMELYIPVPRSKVENDPRSVVTEAEQLLLKRPASTNVDMMRVGLLLPLLDETSRAHLRLQEYYEGVLIAVNEMKERGANVELYVFEIGKGSDTSKLESLLGTLEMQSLHLVIGGVNDAQIKVLSDFARSNKIRYVVPFSQSNGEVLNNGFMIQVNPLNSIIHTKAVAYFANKFRGANFVFVGGGSSSQKDFIAMLQSTLKKQNVAYESVGSSQSLATTVAPMLKQGRENVIVPMSSDLATARQITSELKKFRSDNPDVSITLLGHPDWHTFTNLKNDFASFSTHIYTPFYVDDKAAETTRFNSEFQKWYERRLLKTYPSYAIWGYDTSLFFMTALQRYGLNFEQNINNVNVPLIQFPFHFERLNNWGGLINGAVYILQYDKSGSIQKTKLTK